MKYYRAKIECWVDIYGNTEEEAELNIVNSMDNTFDYENLFIENIHLLDDKDAN